MKQTILCRRRLSKRIFAAIGEIVYLLGLEILHYRKVIAILEKHALIFQRFAHLQTTLYIAAMLIMHGESVQQRFNKTPGFR
ncbi:MAG: hypothetical protein C0469_02900 [Cyanobacteria bacterium DS2.3.42]|nr:hypothetical protein [Cyanobacteria bacterium DS2.3.42]